MAWLSAIGVFFLYLLLPFIVLLRWLLLALAPLLHLGGYIFSGMIFPLRFLAKFEVRRCNLRS